MNETSLQIESLRKELGNKLCILGHHYQSDAVIAHCDYTGDSLELARRVPSISAEHIVFCGVYFMGESAALLAGPEQKVYLPDENADCVMARMAPATLLEEVLQKLAAAGRKIIPVAYVNTSLAIKAVVGRHGGTVCTSANAQKVLKWALDNGDAVLFLPDKNLARNTAEQLALDKAQQYVVDIRQGGRIDLDRAREARLLIWPGCCAIHAKFNAEKIARVRKACPSCLVAVHPECSPETVGAADAVGSTSFLIDYVAKAPAGSTVVIGTEINLVERLRTRHAGFLRVMPLDKASCSHMAKVTEEKLAKLLAAIKDNQAGPLTVVENLKEPARLSLERMLEMPLS